ncbi:MAG TPA: metalloregulator ArsR/SmtB family transcription factor [Kofleriaceae bacterium]|nr:metalloregulator ArsR/SmtB family transcription factor [Kofleriaceae bacterium]
MRVYGSKADELAQLYKALGDETRVRIVHLLARRGELCVCDVETILAVSQSKASRHLNYLKQAGIVEDRRDRTWVYYRLAREARPSLRAAVRELRKELADDETALADLDSAECCARGQDCTPIEASSPRRTRS